MDQQSHTPGVRQGYSQRRQADASNAANSRNPRPDDDEEYDDIWPSRMPTSARRYQSDTRSETGHTSDVQMSSQREYRTSGTGRTGGNSVPPRRTATQSMNALQTPRRNVTQHVPATQSPRRGSTQHVPTQSARRRPSEDFYDDTPQHTSGLLKASQPRARGGFHFHWLVYLGLAMIGMLLCWMLLTSFMGWWQVKQDDLQYGRPRTSQYDYVVGHGDSTTNKSHFIATNLNRHVYVIECPAGDCSKAKVLIGPVLIGQNQDLAPVTLTFKDVNGDGKPDLIINVANNHFVFINDSGSFRPTRASDNIHM